MVSAIKTFNKMTKNKKPINLLNIQKQLAKERIRLHTAQKFRLQNTKCKKCGSTENLTRHHEEYKKNSIIILCRKCHEALHRNNALALHRNNAIADRRIKCQEGYTSKTYQE